MRMTMARWIGVVALCLLGSACGGGGGGTSVSGLACPASGSGTCKNGELDAYVSCVLDHCDGAFQACYGSGYRSGMFGGACATEASCSARCGCDQSSCRSACGPASSSCQSCINNQISPCYASAPCTLPSCAFGLSGTCADLAACCSSATDATFKSECQTQYNSVKSSGDTFCALAITAFRSEGHCN